MSKPLNGGGTLDLLKRLTDETIRTRKLYSKAVDWSLTAETPREKFLISLTEKRALNAFVTGEIMHAQKTISFAKIDHKLMQGKPLSRDEQFFLRRLLVDSRLRNMQWHTLVDYKG